MKVVLATGVPELDMAIEERVNGVNFVGSALYKEAVIDVLSEKNPDILIISEILEGVLPMRELILALRTRFPEVRIIFILKDENPKEKAFLYHWMVFDVLTGSFKVPELENLLHNPKEFKDVHVELDELKTYQKSSDLIVNDDDISDMTGINGDNYQRINGPEAGTDTLYQQIVAFWSVLDQSGKTFSIVNTSLALAGRKELKILLLDFNLDNPNVNLYYSFVDPNKNLGALIDDIENGKELSKDNLDDYLITHPTYNNLKILPGTILKMKKRDDKFMYELFEEIIGCAEQSNFTTILIDTKAGLEDLSVNILKKASKILLHISETPGSLNSIHRYFDTQVGPFVEKLVDKRKITPVITCSHDETRANFKRAVESFLELRVGAIIDFFDEVRPSLYKGVPLLSKKPKEEIYDTFVIVSNLIHKNIFRKPIKRTDSSNNDKASNKNKGSALDFLGKILKSDDKEKK